MLLLPWLLVSEHPCVFLAHSASILAPSRRVGGVTKTLRLQESDIHPQL